MLKYLSPIEAVWARLRRDLAVREMADLKAGRCLSVCQYKSRASQILTSYSFPQSGESMSYLSRLLRGMPRRLAKCKANGSGRCGEWYTHMYLIRAGEFAAPVLECGSMFYDALC